MKLMQKTVWAITPEMLQTMMTIARQNNKSPEAIAKEMGRNMKNTYAVSTRGGVAVIPATGPLFRHANLLTAVCGATSYELLAQDFNKALNDPNISAILFDVDSPDGEVNGCSELADMIYNARGKRPILAYASGSCCSGAYWIASACDKIMAADQGINCPLYRCRYVETTLKTTEGHQAWGGLLKLSEQNLSKALEVAKCLEFDLVLMAELLPVGILDMRQGGND